MLLLVLIEGLFVIGLLKSRLLHAPLARLTAVLSLILGLAVPLITHIRLHHGLGQLRLVHALLLVGLDSDLGIHRVKVLLRVSEHVFLVI